MNSGSCPRGHTPNAVTVNAMKAASAGKVAAFSTVNELFEDLTDEGSKGGSEECSVNAATVKE